MWTEPKTNWVLSDKFNYSDYNRIKNNIAYLKERALELYPKFPFEDMGDDKGSYADYPYADEFTAMENNLEMIKINTYPFYADRKKSWFDNQNTPTYEDFNRLENACLKIHDGLIRQTNSLRKLQFILGTNPSDIKI